MAASKKGYKATHSKLLRHFVNKNWGWGEGGFFLSPFSPLDKNGSYKNLHIKPMANDRLKQAQIDSKDALANKLL